MKTSIRIIIALAINTIIASPTWAVVNVYLENNYGARLNYKNTPSKPEGDYIGNNVRISLGDINSIPSLAIRATGIGSSYVSSYYDLDYILKEIRSQQKIRDLHGQDAVISVGPSRIGWNVTYDWEQKTQNVKPFEYSDFPADPAESPLTKEEQLMELKTAEQRLDAIKNGALGPQYAQKAAEICAANYAQAEKLGKINLCAELKRNLVAPVYKRDTRARVASPDLRPAIDDIQRSINTLHNALTRYRTRGEAS